MAQKNSEHREYDLLEGQRLLSKLAFSKDPDELQHARVVNKKNYCKISMNHKVPFGSTVMLQT